ncbi:MAG: extracellular solute-binding protein [Proteobacteria bacterium]|nr:extracellular solute-binding protein [Pseudomonadota bacterium]
MSRHRRRAALLAAALALGPTVTLAATDREVNIYSWAEYFPSPLLRKFEAETGIKVNYAVMDSNDVMETTLSAGHSGFDLVTVNASPHLGREIPRRLWQPLDLKRIPNRVHADPVILATLAAVDPGNRYAIPWMWGTTGILSNPALVAAAGARPGLRPGDMVFRAADAARLADCGITVLDSWVDVLPMLANWLGRPSLEADGASLAELGRAFAAIRPYLRRVTTSGYYQQLAHGELCVALGYSGDAMVARRMAAEAGRATPIHYDYPDGTVYVFVDSFAIPADAPHPEAAHRFIDFAMRPENAASVATFIGFASGNIDAIPLLDPELQRNRAVYPDAEVRSRLRLGRVYTAAEERRFGRAWLRMKAGQPVGDRP